MMQSGALRHRLLIEAITKVPDGLGGFVNGYSTIATIYGSVWGIKGETQLEGGRPTAAVTHRIRIRFRRIFKTTWRIKDLFSGKYYSIITMPVDLADEHKWLEFSCKEVSV
jgi:SPP1 family predicted phage head-tail adaptor